MEWRLTHRTRELFPKKKKEERYEKNKKYNKNLLDQTINFLCSGLEF